MNVGVDLAAHPPAERLEEPEDFKGFKVVVRGEGALDEALAPLGRVEDGTAHLRIDAVRGLAGAHADDPAWRRSFDAMIDYAQGKGWVDERREVVQAHCERA
jgi:hypothetical protein